MASTKLWQWLTGLTEKSLDGSEEVYLNDAGSSKKTTTQAIADLNNGVFAPVANGVTNGDSHDHSGGDGAQIDYLSLSSLPPLGTASEAETGDFLPTSAGITVDATTSRSLSASDAGKEIVFTSGSAIAVTVPDDLAVGFQCVLTQAGAGIITVNRSTTDTINGGASVATAAQYDSIYLRQYAEGAFLSNGQA